MMRSWGWPCLLVLAASCTFKADVPDSSDITCSASQACPSGFACRPALGRCVALASLNRPAVGVSGQSVSPSTGNLATTFTASFQVSQPLFGAPTVYAEAFQAGGVGSSVQTYPFTCGACAPGATCQCTWTPGASNPPGAGPLNVEIQVIDNLGNEPPPTQAGTVVLDLTAPDLQGPASLTLVAPKDAPGPVTLLGGGGTAELCFTADKTLGETPTVVAVPAQAGPDGGGLPFTLGNGYPEGGHYCFDLDGPSDAGPGLTPLDLWAFLIDTVGNSAWRLALGDGDGGLGLLTTPPPPPNLDADGGLIYHRAPWGEMPTIGQPAFSLRSAGVAFAEEGYLVLSADDAGAVEVARTRVAAGALDPPLALPGPDTPEVYAAFWDLAGNPAPGGPLRVSNVEWVASLGRKVIGDNTANPHSCFGRPVLAPALAQPDDPVNELDATSGPAEPATGAAPIGGAATWRLRQAGPVGEPAAWAYDSARNRLVSFGLGANGQQTWEFDGIDWREADDGTGIAPTPRLQSTMVYDAARGTELLFGGDLNETFNNGPLCDTWLWNGTQWTLAANCVTANYVDGGQAPVSGPPLRDGQALAYDPLRARTILIGGSEWNGFSSDTWEWDGSTWTALPAADGGPLGFYDATMTWRFLPDGGGALVLQGGQLALLAQNEPTSNETQFGVWNGTEYVWQVEAGSPVPADGGLPTTAWVVGSPLGDLLAASLSSSGVVLWTWDDSTSSWKEGPVEAAFDQIDDFAWARFADGGAGVWLAVEGANLPGPTTLACPLPLSTCGLVHQGGPLPPQLEQQALAGDGLGHALLYSGISPTGDTYANDAWLWSGSDWSQTTNGPPGVGGRVLAYEAAIGDYWLTGQGLASQPSDVWAFHPDAGWSELTVHALPSALAYPVTTYVPSVGVLGIGQAANFTSYTDILAPAPDGGVAGSAGPTGLEVSGWLLAFDSVRGVAVASTTNPDVNSGLPDFAEWNPESPTWIPVVPAGIGPYDYPFSASEVFDPISQSLLIVGGQRLAGAVAGDVWRWDGETLTNWPLADPEGDGEPAVRELPNVGADPAHGGVFMYAGATGPVPFNDTWTMSNGANRPAVVCLFTFAAANADPSALLEQVVIAGQAGSAPGNTDLELWQAGAWARVASCDAGACSATTPGPLSYATTAVAPLLADRDAFGVALDSDAPNGSSQSQVRADALQVTVSYRLP